MKQTSHILPGLVPGRLACTTPPHTIPYDIGPGSKMQALSLGEHTVVLAGGKSCAEELPFTFWLYGFVLRFYAVAGQGHPVAASRFDPEAAFGSEGMNAVLQQSGE